MNASDATTNDALAVARRFIDALNARDLDALSELVTDETEFRRLRGETLRGHQGARALVAAAEDVGIRFVPLHEGTAEPEDGRVHVTLPVRELIGPDDIERRAEFTIRDGRLAEFALRPYE